VTPPPPPISPPPPPAPRAAAKPEPRKPAAGKAAKRKPARTAPRERTIPKEFLDQTVPPPVGLSSRPAGPAVADSGGDGAESSAVQVLIIAAAALALLSLALAAVPLGALERLLAADAHWRTEQVATFVDGHRLDIIVGGVATLLAAVVVALPTVAG
jgi:hypothetical protein